MEISLREALARPNGQERDTYTCFQEKHLKGFPRLVLERGFFFLLITRGAALFTDTHGKHPLRAKDLILLTPGMTGRLCLLYTSPSPRDAHESRMPSSA